MTSFIKITMQKRGIVTSEEELTDLEARWQSLTEMKEKVSPPNLLNIDMALQNIPRSGENE